MEYIFRNKILDWFNEQIKTKDLSQLYNSIVDVLKQIEERKHDMELKDEGYEDILNYSLFGGKDKKKPN